MRSASARATRDDDVTTRARIRDAALVRFGRDGVAATGVRAVAADAGVSAGLVLHHFGSKDGLRRACDEHVATVIREIKEAQAEDPMGSMDGWVQKVHELDWLRDYLARELTEGGELAATLFADLSRDAEAYLARWEQHGLVRPSDDPAVRAAYLTATSLGMLVLRPLLARHLGVPDGPDVLVHVSRSAMDLYTHGLFADPAVGEQLAAKLQEGS
ncbi:TetR family transcriptional regulator [Aquipuribacter nitratireducens]|uniref:TetR family transcriptional regulator n=1 Tax=Aquipuribacter nitratireducens TaxID=650104 RepID=A0ABW0GHX5_9MICO